MVDPEVNKGLKKARLAALTGAALSHVHDTTPEGNLFDKTTDRLTRLELITLRDDAAKLYARLNDVIADRELKIVRRGRKG